MTNSARWPILILAAGLAIAGAAAVPAAGKDRAPPPAIVSKLLDCRTVTDASARLACFDAQVAAIDTAMAANDLMIADRTQVDKARRSLFGLNLPDFNIFGGNDDSKAVVAAIDSVVVDARKGPDRNWRLTLEDGSRWVQTDTKSLARDPRKGMPVHIKRGAIGSFLANIDKQIAIRVQRMN